MSVNSIPSDRYAAVLCQAESLRQQACLPEAKTLLFALLDDAPDYLAGWVALAMITREQGYHDDALAYWSRARILHPDHATLSVDMAVELRLAGRLDQAADMLADFLQHRPDSVPGWIELAQIARQQGSPNLALVHFRHALSLDTRHATLPVDIATILVEQNHLTEADALLRDLLDRHPTVAPAWIVLAQICRLRGDHESALRFFRDAYALLPDHPTLPVDIAVALQSLGLLDQAESLLQNFLMRLPDSVPGWIVLAQVAREQGRKAVALMHFQRAYALQPLHPTVPVDIANGLFEQGRISDAQDILLPFLQHHPDSVPGRIVLAQIARQQGDGDAALRHFRHALACQPDHDVLPVDIAAELFALGRLDEAATSLSLFLARQSDSRPALLLQAQIARQRGDHESALMYFCRVDALEAQPVLLADITAALCALGRLDEARQMLLQRLSHSTAPAGIWLQLGLLAQYRDDAQESIRCFYEGIQAQPTDPQCHVALIWEYLSLGWLDQADVAIANGVQQAQPSLRVALMQVRLHKCRGALDDALALADELYQQSAQDFEAGYLLAELQTMIAAFDQATATLAGLVVQSLPDRFLHAMLRAHLALAHYDLDAAQLCLGEALVLNSKDAGALHLQTVLYLMRGDSRSGGVALKTTQTVLGEHPSARQRAQARGGLRDLLWREFRTNPFAEQTLAHACRLPLSEQPAAMVQALANEPEHAGTAMALLIALHRLGVWHKHAPLPVADANPIPRRIVQFWDTPEIPDDILHTMQSWPRACRGFEHQVFNDYSAATFIRRECAPEVYKAFRKANHPAMRADLFRLAYLSVYGGIYADADDLCRHSLAGWLVPGYDLLLMQEDIGSIGNNFLAASPAHPLICAVLDRVVKNIMRQDGDNVWFVSGPGVLTQIFCCYYGRSIEVGRLPAGVRIQDMYHCQQAISMHLPRSYKQDARHWSSAAAAPRPIFRPVISVAAGGFNVCR